LSLSKSQPVFTAIEEERRLKKLKIPPNLKININEKCANTEGKKEKKIP
jgi:hypothetical protein